MSLSNGTGPALSVILPTHAPHVGRLGRALEGLKLQSLSYDRWELVVVDNRSPDPVRPDLGWHPHTRVVREDRLGLTHARLAGGASTRGDVLVFVDDDNVLSSNYLAAALELFANHPRLGAAGGKSVPEWETPPSGWVHEFAGTLALRDLGNEARVCGPSETGYPTCAPIGAGMAVRRSAWNAYTHSLAGDRTSPSDRTGQNLSSGGDNDIVLHVLRAGWQVGYFPQLSLTHLIPETRIIRGYLARLNDGISKSWVQVVARHDICPWPPANRRTVPLRKVRAYFRYKAWAGPAEYIRWKGACGNFEGRALIGRSGRTS